MRLDVHDVNSIASLPGNPSAKDKEKEVEVNPGRKMRSTWEKGRQCRLWMKLVGYASS